MTNSATPALARIVERAARRCGIVSYEEILEEGAIGSTITNWVRTGRLFRMYPGVYSIVPPAMCSQEATWLAAVMACGSASALSHGPAGQWHGFIDRRERFAIHVTVADRHRVRIPGIVVHRPRVIAPEDMTTRLGIPVTAPTRTIWDLATQLSPKQTRRAFGRAERTCRVDRTRLAALAEAAPMRNGAGTIRTLLAEKPLPLAAVRTWLEELLVLVCAEHHLPLPAINVPLLGYEIDFLWERERFIVEADGGEHLNQEQRDRDNRRDFELGRAGFLPRRYSWRDMKREEEVAAEIAAILHERANPPHLLPFPAGVTDYGMR